MGLNIKSIKVLAALIVFSLTMTVGFLFWQIRQVKELKSQVGQLNEEKTRIEMELVAIRQNDERLTSSDPCRKEIVKAEGTDYAAVWLDERPRKLFLCKRDKSGLYKKVESSWVRVKNGFFTSFYFASIDESGLIKFGFHNFVFDINKIELVEVLESEKQKNKTRGLIGVYDGFFGKEDLVSQNGEWVFLGSAECVECSTNPDLYAYNVVTNRLERLGFPRYGSYKWVGQNTAEWEEVKWLFNDDPSENAYPVKEVSLGKKTKTLY